MKTVILLSRLLAGMLLAGLAGLVAAQPTGSYPSRTVTVVRAAVPGGSVETVMRELLSRISRTTGQQFIIMHKSGAGGAIGADFVAKANPDGYTLLAAEASFTTPPEPGQALPYDPVKDFAPVSLICRWPVVLMVHPSLPVTSVKEYFDYARAHPGEINFGSAGATTRFNGEWMNKAAGVDIRIIDYKGTGQMMPDLLAGRIHATAISFRSSMPHIKSGKMKALGISTPERSKLWPQLPTIAEQGATGYAYVGWMGLFAPAGTPKAIVDKLHAEFSATAQDAVLRQKLEDQFVEIVTASPAQTDTFMKTETEAKRRVQAMITGAK